MIVRSEPHFLEVLNKDAGKASALAELAALLNIDSENIMAIGDNENDLSMIEYAGVGVAMGNAVDKVKEAADFITKSNAESGVAHAIRTYLNK
ncbi:Sugar phosphatase YidA [bioreactor metagenome]|uniref:Sugar phosphatase YidA n=1 Tax=bioreactor metagenome TaxID=1076179 RepID=A0A644YL16_9ZZZZ